MRGLYSRILTVSIAREMKSYPILIALPLSPTFCKDTKRILSFFFLLSLNFFPLLQLQDLSSGTIDSAVIRRECNDSRKIINLRTSFEPKMPELKNLRAFTSHGLIVLIIFIALIFNGIAMELNEEEPPLGTAWPFMLLFYGSIVVAFAVGAFSGDGPSWGS